MVTGVYYVKVEAPIAVYYVMHKRARNFPIFHYTQFWKNVLLSQTPVKFGARR